MGHAPVLITGETLVDFIPNRPGPLKSVEQFSRRVGGAAANVAVALARLERPPLFWTRVGQDPFGDFVAETLEKNNVNMRFVERDPVAKTGLSFVRHDESGTPEFTIYRDGMADTRLTPGTIDDDVTQQLDWVYMGGVQLSANSTREATFDLLEQVRDTDTDVWFDPNARPELWTNYDFETTIKEVLPFVDVVKSTLTDLEDTHLPTENSEALASALCEQKPNTAFITSGSKGAFAKATPASPFDMGTCSHDGFEVEVLDTTGAGDAFTGGALIASLEGITDLREVLELSNAVAALSTTKKGALSALPNRQEVVKFLKSRGREGLLE